MLLNLLDKSNQKYVKGAVGDIPLARHLTEINALKTGAGVMIAFCSDSSRVSVKFNVDKLLDVTAVMGRVLMNGINFVVYNKGRKIVAYDCITRTKEEFVTLCSNEKREMLEYRIFLPHYNVVSEMIVDLDDPASITPVNGDQYILFLGGSILMGRGATFSTTSFSTLVANSTNHFLYNLGLHNPNFYNEQIMQHIGKLKPRFVVANLVEGDTTVDLVSRLCKQYVSKIMELNVPTIFVEPSFNAASAEYRNAKKNAEEILLSYSNRNDVFLLRDSEILRGIPAEDASFSGNHINDLGHYCIAQRIIEIIEVLKKRYGVF